MNAAVFARHGLTLLLDASLKGLLVLALVGAALLLGRRASASARHLTVLLGLTSFLALPLLSLALPHWQVPFWPQAATALPPAPVSNALADDHPAPETPPELSPLRPPGIAPSVSAVPAAPLAVAPPSSARPPFPWPVWLFGVWLLGAGIALLPTLVGLLAVHRLGRRCRRIEDGPIAALGREQWAGRPLSLLCGEAGDSSVVPMTWGWLRPVILLPSGAESWPPDRLRVVLLHELAHIRRADWPCQMAAHVVCALYWFHPGVWLLARQLRLESERACDDYVLAAGVPPDDYARHLLDVVRLIKDSSLRVVLPMAQMSHMEERLRAVLANRRNRRPVSRPAQVTAAVVAAGSLITLGALHPAASPLPPRSTQQQGVRSALPARNQSRARPAAAKTTRPPALHHDTAKTKGVSVMNRPNVSKHVLSVAAFTAIASSPLSVHGTPPTKAHPKARPVTYAPKATATSARSAPALVAAAPRSAAREPQPPRATLTVEGDASRLTLNAAQAPITDVLARLFKQSGRNYSLSPDVGGLITLSLSGAAPDDALNAVLAASAQPLVYGIKDGTYFVHGVPIDAVIPADENFQLHSLPLKNVTPQYVLDALRKSDEWRALLPARNVGFGTRAAAPSPPRGLQFEGVHFIIPAERGNALVVEASPDGYMHLRDVVLMLDGNAAKKNDTRKY